MIPPRVDRKQPRDFDKYLYKVRHLMKRFVSRIKQYRRVASRYNTGRNFQAFVQVAIVSGHPRSQRRLPTFRPQPDDASILL